MDRKFFEVNFLRKLKKKGICSLGRKNVGRDRFLVIFKISEKIDLKKFAVHTFVSKTFYKK